MGFYIHWPIPNVKVVVGRALRGCKSRSGLSALVAAFFNIYLLSFSSELKSELVTPQQMCWAGSEHSELVGLVFPGILGFQQHSWLERGSRFAFVQRDELSSTSANSKFCWDSFLPWAFPWSSFFIPWPGISCTFSVYKAFQRENKALFTPKPLHVRTKHKVWQ